MARNLFIIIVLSIATLSTAQEFPSMGFEEWVVENNDTNPKGWTLSPFGAGRSTDAAGGQSALSIWNWYCYAEGTASVVMPFTQSGTIQIRGQYKYELGKNGGSGHDTDDSAVVIAVLKKHDTVTTFSDTVGYAEIKLGPTESYMTFSISVGSKTPPDTLELYFSSSESGFCSSEDCQCCYLTLDNLSWGKLAVNVSGEAQPALEPAVPNPFEQETNLGIAPVGGCRIVVSSLEGVDVHEQEFHAGEQIVFFADDLPSGTYIYRIISKIDIRTGKVIKR